MREVAMFDPGMIRLFHPHGDELHPMRPRSTQHDPAGSDPEREWLRHGRVYECECGTQVTVLPEHAEEPGRPYVP
jgi:hypothetical protein